MTVDAAPYPTATRSSSTSAYVPPATLECLYYAQIVYAIMGPIFGVSIGMLGIGLLAIGVAICAVRMGRYSVVLMTPIFTPLACGAFYIGIQVFLHRRSVSDEYVREFVPWMAALVILQFLALRRGFLHRSALVMVLMGLATLPYLRSFVNDEGRMGLEKGISIANPNDLGAWFGFCCVYLTIVGLETRRYWMRAVAWLGAAGCLLVIGMTVSRGPLLATACAIVFAFRRILKRGFVPFFSLVLIASLAYAAGFFDQSVSMYAARGLEDSGRIGVWPRAIARIVEDPLTGVGSGNMLTPRPNGGGPVTPHNAFIFIGLASGVVPLAFFAAYWLRLARDTRRLSALGHEDAAFQMPLVLYAFLIVVNLNEPFMLPWVMCTLASVTGAGFLLTARTAMAGAARAGRPSGRSPLPALARRPA